MSKYKSKYPITVVIPTNGLYHDLQKVVNKIRSQVDQVVLVISNADKHKLTTKNKFAYENVTIAHSPEVKVSARRNIGVNNAKNPIVGFLDDDCHVAKNWAEIVFQKFQNYPKIECLTGSVLPYREFDKNKYYCPSIFKLNNQSHIKQPVTHWKHIGSGNNIVFRKKSFDEIGGYKEWLGYGSRCLGAEDADIILSLIKNKKTILYCPRVVVYHDKLVKIEDKLKYTRGYSVGGVAVYTYHAIRTHPPLFIEVVRQYFSRIRMLVNAKRVGKTQSLPNLFRELACDYILMTRAMIISFTKALQS